MINKNAYEIRLELLKMSKEMLDQQYNDASALYWDTVSKLAENWNKTAEEIVNQTLSAKPKIPTPQEIVEKAQELYKFVDKSNSAK
jgi:hypothetical protein